MGTNREQSKIKPGQKPAMGKQGIIKALQQKVQEIQGHGLEGHQTSYLPLKDEALNTPFPGSGLPLHALHEICGQGMEAELGAAGAAFTASLASQILAKQSGSIIWAVCRLDCYGLGLSTFGLDMGRVLWVDCRKDSEVLGVMEEALFSRSVPVVIGEIGALDLKSARRLDAASRRTGSAALLLRRPVFSVSQAHAEPSGAAASRWRVQPIGEKALKRLRLEPESRLEPGFSPSLWRLDLEYCRNGKPASWIVEASHESTGAECKAGHVRVVAELCHDTGAVKEPAARKAGRAARSA
jgi:hypothetical protein